MDTADFLGQMSFSHQISKTKSNTAFHDGVLRENGTRLKFVIMYFEDNCYLYVFNIYIYIFIFTDTIYI